MKIWSSIDSPFTALYSFWFSISSIQPSKVFSSKCLSMVSPAENWPYKISSRGVSCSFIFDCLMLSLAYFIPLHARNFSPLLYLEVLEVNKFHVKTLFTGFLFVNIPWFGLYKAFFGILEFFFKSLHAI